MFGFKGTDKSIVSNGLVLYMDAANPQSYISSSITVYDLAKVGRRSTDKEIFNGTIDNGVGFSTENKGYWTFDGVDDQINIQQVSNNTILSLNQQTISIWLNQIGGRMYIVAGNTGNDRNRKFYLYGNQTTFLRYLIGNGSTTAQCQITSGFPGLGNWFNMTCSYDLKTMRLYINGSEVQTTSTTIIPYKASNNFIRVGERTQPSTDDFEGDIALWMVYNRALTANEVQHNFETLRGRFGI